MRFYFNCLNTYNQHYHYCFRVKALSSANILNHVSSNYKYIICSQSSISYNKFSNINMNRFSSTSLSSSTASKTKATFFQKLKNSINPTKRSIIISCIMFTIFGIGFYLAYSQKVMRKNKKRLDIAKKMFGGSFELVDTDGNTVTEKIILGKWSLIYFGFTHCPDICPEELEKICIVMNKFKQIPNIPEIIPIFVSVDPNRDTPEAVKKYLKDYPGILGLTGTYEQVKKACSLFHVYSEPHKPDDKGEYIVDHTIITYLINPNCEFVDYYMRNNTSDQIVKSVLKHIDNYKALNRKSLLNLF